MLNNFRSILRYNQAKSYALAVGHLADRLAGYGPFVVPWPTGENRLSLEQRMELQQDLITLGHLEGEVDGIIGSGTLEGIRSYQRAKGLPVDGYPTLTILKRLRAEAPPPAPPPPAAPAPVKAETQVVPAAPAAAPATGQRGDPGGAGHNRRAQEGASAELML